MKSGSNQPLPFSALDMIDFLARKENAQHVRVSAALDHYRLMKADIAAAIEQDAARVPAMAQDALEAAILGMRRATTGRVEMRRPQGLFFRIFPSLQRQQAVHPSFDNDAYSIFISLLFDAIHNLPALMAPHSGAPYSSPDPANEIALTLACLRLLPATSAAADSRFERLFMSRESAGAKSRSGAHGETESPGLRGAV